MSLTINDFISTQYKDYNVFPKSGNINVRSMPGTDQAVLTSVSAGKKIGVVAALYKFKKNGYNWYYVKLAQSVNGKTHGFVAGSVVNFVKGGEAPTSTQGNNQNQESDKEKAKTLINDVIKRDIIIYKRLITAYWVLVKLQQKGKNVDAQMKVLQALAMRLGERQSKIKQIINENKNDVNFKVNYNPIADLSDYNKLRKTLGLGVIPIVIVIVVLIVAVSATATILIQSSLKPAYDAQTVDLDFSGKFGDYIKSLPDSPEKQAAIADVEKQIDDAYNDGKADGASGSSWKWIKTAGIVGLSIWGFTKLLDVSEKWRNKRNVNAG